MKQYIGTKIVQAEPAYRVDGNVFVKANIVPCGVHIEDGYKVVYPDRYESWSPKDVFEAAYRETSGMSFGLAIEAAKMGKKIARAGWNGKVMLVQPRGTHPEGVEPFRRQQGLYTLCLRGLENGRPVQS